MWSRENSVGRDRSLPQILTLGYATIMAAELDGILGPDGILVDIRIYPGSRKPGFDGVALADRLGERYTHVRAFGNTRHKRQGVALLDPEAGLESLGGILACGPERVVLMCGCKYALRCHRSVVAALVEERLGLAVTHLGPLAPEASGQQSLFE